MKDGDWFLRTDADEFHHIHPETFIKERLRPYETIVYHQYYNFELTAKEAAQLQTKEKISEERKKKVQDRRRHYTVSVYSEPRLCRYRSSMQWPQHVSFPFNAGFIARERLPILHYPNRDPLQMDRRCQLRAVMLADKENKLNWTDHETMHWTIADWKKFVVKDDDPALNFWVPGSALPEIKQSNHLAKLYKRIPQFIFHSLLLQIADSRRPSYPDDGYPQRIPPDVVRILNEILSLEISDMEDRMILQKEADALSLSH
jgi:hypothetical protein